MTKRSILILAAGAALILGGCQKKSSDGVGTNPDVTDLDTASRSAPPPSSYSPEPMYADALTTQTPVGPGAAPTGGGGQRYQVQRGDTLYSLALRYYGDGKQWQRIASANPGLTPQNLKAGQTIVIP